MQAILETRLQEHDARVAALPPESIAQIVQDQLRHEVPLALWLHPQALGEMVTRLAESAMDALVGQHVAVGEGQP